MRQGVLFFWRRPTGVYDFLLFFFFIHSFFSNHFCLHSRGQNRSRLYLTRPVSLFTDLREQAQENQLDYVYDQVLVDERIREQIQRVLDIALHGRKVICRKVL